VQRNTSGLLIGVAPIVDGIVEHPEIWYEDIEEPATPAHAGPA
jgi:hypothetical protein